MYINKNTCGFCKHYIPHYQESLNGGYVELIVGHCDHLENRYLNIGETARIDNRVACELYEVRV